MTLMMKWRLAALRPVYIVVLLFLANISHLWHSNHRAYNPQKAGALCHFMTNKPFKRKVKEILYPLFCSIIYKHIFIDCIVFKKAFHWLTSCKACTIQKHVVETLPSHRPSKQGTTTQRHLQKKKKMMTVKAEFIKCQNLCWSFTDHQIQVVEHNVEFSECT